MGHCAAIALGLATSRPDKKVFCIDGDGSLLMHMGIMTTIGNTKKDNFYHILINNGMHESVGGQKTAASSTQMLELAKSTGYKHVVSYDNIEQLNSGFITQINNGGPNFIELKVNPGFRKNLGRPTISTIDSRDAIMKFIKDS